MATATKDETTVTATDAPAEGAKTRNRKTDEEILAVLKKDKPTTVDDRLDRMMELREAKNVFVKRMDSAKVTFDKAKTQVAEIDKAINDVAASFKE